MKNTELIQYFEAHSDPLNKVYFEALQEQFHRQHKSELTLFHPEHQPDSLVYPYAILEQKNLMPLTHYQDLSGAGELSSDLRLIKMHAGLGSSVKRQGYLHEKTGRTSLGSKGTDLFLGDKSLAALQIEQVRRLNQKAWTQKVYLQNLVNEQTREIVDSTAEQADFILPCIQQFKMPTVAANGELSLERTAPGGHGFLGFTLLHEIFLNPSSKKEIIAIGNGEDLNSTPDQKILTWMERNEIPICMITTTKTKRDIKGGQLALVMEPTPYLTIIEKAQADKAQQTEYFEQLGLRETDDISLFNTNIVLLNRHVLAKEFQKTDLSEKEFLQLMAPDLIKNQKQQGGREFIQLEGAIASVMLNLDKYYRQNHQSSLIRLLNLNQTEREEFFIPIKTMDDFYHMLERYEYDENNARLRLR